jgi:hypothetical protein
VSAPGWAGKVWWDREGTLPDDFFDEDGATAAAMATAMFALRAPGVSLPMLLTLTPTQLIRGVFAMAVAWERERVKRS